MTVKRTSHTVYDTKYHLVWAPKYRKWILRGDIQQRVAEIFREIAANHDIEVDTMEIAKDHVHLFVSFPLCANGGRYCDSRCDPALY